MKKIKRIDRTGYYYIHKPKHPLSGKQGYVAEHRLIMEKKIGRYLTKQEVVHHINGDRKDNRIKNLILFKNNSEHQKTVHKDVWNKGLKTPKETREKISLACKGREPNKTSFKKGFIPWNKGLMLKNDLRIAQPWLGIKRPNLKNTNAKKTMFKKGQIPWNKK